jgi:helicase
MEAVSKGILEGQRMLVCTNTATGKTFLSSLIASSSGPGQKVVYLSPTRSLAEEVNMKIKDYLLNTDQKVAISTRERPESDEIVNECSVVIATYEKFNSLLKHDLLEQSSLKTIIIDEVHKIGEHDRGITLEFIMNRFNKLNGKAPQVVALSGMINDNDVQLFSDWMHARKVKSRWRPIDLTEMILHGGYFHMKDGTLRDAGFGMPSADSDFEKRMKATFRLIQTEIVRDGQCLVISMSRSKVETVAEEICNKIKSTVNPDIEDLQLNDAQLRHDITRKIHEIEPQLPLYARNLAEMIKHGVAYHHAGLPLRYRSIIEDGVRKKGIRVIVATTTLEAGVNLPVSMVIFPSPRERSGKFSHMTTSTYRNLAGRAGRPEFDSSGSSVLIALTPEEVKLIKEYYFDKEDDELKSGMTQFMKKVPETRYAVQTEILSLIKESAIREEDITNEMKNLWFWKKASDTDKQELPGRLSWEIEKLRRFECIERRRDGKIALNRTGRIVNRSMLYAFSIKNLLDNCRRIMQGNFDEHQFDILILSAVGIPNEMRSYNDTIKDIKISPETVFVQNIMKQDKYLAELYDDTKYCAQFGTMLLYWINSLNTEAILEKTGLKHTHAAFIEESLRQDAFWILSVISRMPSSILAMTDKQRKRVVDLAKFCQLGTSDPIVIGLLDLGLSRMGRTTAIKIADYLKTHGLNASSLKKKEIENLFPDNKHCAGLLYEELSLATQSKEKK